MCVKSLEFVKYFRFLKGKNIGKFDFYRIFNNIIVMLNECILFFLFCIFIIIDRKKCFFFDESLILKIKVIVR